MTPRRGRPVEARELGPLGDQHGRVGALERLQRLVGDDDAGEQRMIAGVEHGVVGAHVGALVDAGAPARTIEAASRRSSVCGLKVRPSSATVLPRSLPEVLLELADHAALLQVR